MQIIRKNRHELTCMLFPHLLAEQKLNPGAVLRETGEDDIKASGHHTGKTGLC